MHLLRCFGSDYPKGATELDLDALVAIRVFIGVDGRPSHPRLLGDRPFETFILAASDAIRDWRFEPARREAEAIAFSWKLTINFVMASH